MTSELDNTQSQFVAAVRGVELVEDEGRIQAALSDSTTNSLVVNTPFQSATRSRRAANSDVRLSPPSASTPSMWTSAAPLLLSCRGSPVVGCRLVVQQTIGRKQRKKPRQPRLQGGGSRQI